jgi:hypothetical protein
MFEAVSDEFETVGLLSAGSDLRGFAETLPHCWELPQDLSHETHRIEIMARAKAKWEEKQAAKKP